MRNEANQNYELPQLTHPELFTCTVCVATWNEEITTPLLEGALQAFRDCGVPDNNINVMRVPGSVELTAAAALAIKRQQPSAVVMLGCVIRGETPHFDYVCQSVTQGMTMLNARGEVPVIFGLVTTENFIQAEERAGGRLGNKGTEAAAAAMQMAMLFRD